jgi:hypothetical protein
VTDGEPPDAPVPARAKASPGAADPKAPAANVLARPPSHARAPAPSSPHPGRIRIDLSSDPEGARVVRVKTGLQLCEATPCSVFNVILPDGQDVLLRLQKPGYAPKDIRAPGWRDGQYDVRLDAAGAPPVGGAAHGE